MLRSRRVPSAKALVLLLSALGISSAQVPEPGQKATPTLPEVRSRAGPARRHGHRQGRAQRQRSERARLRPARGRPAAAPQPLRRRRSAGARIRRPGAAAAGGARRPARRTSAPGGGSRAARRAAGRRPAHRAGQPAPGPDRDAQVRDRAGVGRRQGRRGHHQRQRRRLPGLHERRAGPGSRDRPPAQPLRADRRARPSLPDRAPGRADRPRRRRGAARRDPGDPADRRLPGRGHGQDPGLHAGAPDGGRDRSSAPAARSR